jgi:hypothetical protein
LDQGRTRKGRADARRMSGGESDAARKQYKGRDKAKKGRVRGDTNAARRTGLGYRVFPMTRRVPPGGSLVMRPEEAEIDGEPRVEG